MSGELETLESIGNQCGDPSIGGSQTTIFYAPIDWIDQFPEVLDSNYTYTGPGALVTFLPGKAWLSMTLARDSVQFKETEKKDKQGPFYNQDLEGFIPNPTPAIVKQMNLMRFPRFIVRYYHRSGEQRLIGTLDNPMEFESAFDSKKRSRDSSGHTIRFKSIARDKAPFYTE